MVVDAEDVEPEVHQSVDDDACVDKDHVGQNRNRHVVNEAEEVRDIAKAPAEEHHPVDVLVAEERYVDGGKREQDPQDDDGPNGDPPRLRQNLVGDLRRKPTPRPESGDRQFDEEL